MARALASAGVSPEDVSRILLIGGSSRIPLVAQSLTEQFRRPIAVDANPKHAVALGAAQVALRVSVPPAQAPVVADPPAPSPPPAPAPSPPPAPAPSPPPAPDPAPDPLPPLPPQPPATRPPVLPVLLRALAATGAASIALYVLGRYAGSLPPGWDNNLLSPLAFTTAGALHGAFLATALAATVRLPTVRIIRAGLAAAVGGAVAGFIAEQPVGSNFEEAIGRNAQVASLFIGGGLVSAVVGASVASAAPGAAAPRTMMAAAASAVTGALSWLGAGAASGYLYFSWHTIQFPILATDFTLDFEDLEGDANPFLVLVGLVVAMLPVAIAVVATRPKAPTPI